MVTFQYIVKDEIGIHARPAGILVKEAKKYESIIKVKKGEREVCATQLLGLMSLSAKCGDEITIRVEGPDEKIACSQIKQFLENNM